MSEKLRIGVIGAGGYAEYYHIPLIKRSHDAELVALHRHSADKLANMAQQFGVQHYSTDYRVLLDAARLDAVVISGPFGLHYEWCKSALKHKLHVLVDKPWVYKASEAEELVALARAQELVLMVGYNRRFDPANLYARDAIQSGHLGELVCAHTLQLGYAESRWHYVMDIGGGPMMGRGSHMADLIPWTTGLKPTHVSAHLLALDGGEGFRGGTLTMNLEGKAIGEITALAGKDRPRDEAVYYCTGGSLFVYRPPALSVPGWPYYLQTDHIGTWNVERRDTKGNVVQIDQLPSAYTTTEHFIDVLMGRDQNRCSGEEVVQAVRIIEAAYESSRTGRTLAL